MDGKKALDAVERMLAQPKSVEVDAQKVENQSLADLLKVASYFASKSATSSRRCPVRTTRMVSGGAIL